MTFRYFRRQLGWWAGLTAAICIALMAQKLQPPHDRWVERGAAIGAAIAAYCIQPTRSSRKRERKEDGV